MNTNDTRVYDSRDSFNQVDDPHGIIANMLDEETMNNYNTNGVPPHKLSFKIDDVCLVLRAIPALHLATNTRVKIVSLGQNHVRIVTLNEPSPRYLNITRITFKFRLKYGESYEMTRLQIPLRLAYSMTYNKSQSQTMEQILIDCIGEPFAHGHGYVAFSRAKNGQMVKLFLDESQLHELTPESNIKVPVIKNIVYRELIELS